MAGEASPASVIGTLLNAFIDVVFVEGLNVRSMRETLVPYAPASMICVVHVPSVTA